MFWFHLVAVIQHWLKATLGRKGLISIYNSRSQPLWGSQGKNSSRYLRAGLLDYTQHHSCPGSELTAQDSRNLEGCWLVTSGPVYTIPCLGMVPTTVSWISYICQQPEQSPTVYTALSWRPTGESRSLGHALSGTRTWTPHRQLSCGWLYRTFRRQPVKA